MAEVAPIDPMGTVFHLIWRDVEDTAISSNLPYDLNEEEKRMFLKCLEAGLSSWSEIVALSLMAATVGRGGSTEEMEAFNQMILEEIEPNQTPFRPTRESMLGIPDDVIEAPENPAPYGHDFRTPIERGEEDGA